MNTYKWILTCGLEAKLEARYSEKAVCATKFIFGECAPDDERDGKIIIEDAQLIAYVDGKRCGDCHTSSMWCIIDAGKDGLKRIWGINKIAFTADRAAEIERFLNSVINSGKDAECEKIRAEEMEKRNAKELEFAKKTIRDAEKQKDIPTKSEAIRRLKRYNDIYNEGGEGYLPHIVTLEEYENAKKTVAELENLIP